jgi:hypothetical protein
MNAFKKFYSLTVIYRYIYIYALDAYAKFLFREEIKKY